MGRFDLKNTFTRGIISPLAWARNDIQLYQQAAEDLCNFAVLKEGGVRRRSGTRYRGETKYADRNTRFVDFVFSTTQAYALEFGDLYVRPWADYGNVLSSGSPYEIVSPYSQTSINSISWHRENDVLYIAHASKTIPTKKLKRLAHDNWAFEDVAFIDGPYLPINDQYNALSTSATLTTGASVTFTWANLLGLNGGQGILATDVGRHVRCQFGGKWSWGTITARLTDRTATVLIKEGNGNGGAGSETLDLGGAQSLVKSTDTGTTETGAGNKNKYSSYSWRLGAFSQTTGYPGSVTAYQNRIFYGRIDAYPGAVFYSRSNYPETMSPSDVDGTVTESHGGMLDVRGAGEILWLQEAPRLQIGTDNAIRSLGTSNNDEAFGPRNISQRLEVSQGVSSVRPKVVGPSSVHAGRYSKSLNDLFFDFQANTLVAPELSVTADNLFKPRVKEIVFQQYPGKTLWALLEDGTIAATTVERYEKVIGMSRHSFAGGNVKSIVSIPGASQDEVYMIVRRTINNVAKQYVETLDPMFDPDTMVKVDAFFVDCGGTYSGAATATVSGLSWLEGQTVDILADGHALPRVTVASGAITLPNGRTASKISFGVPISAFGRTLRAPTSVNDGSGLGRKCRVVSIHADVHGTLGLSFRADSGQLDRLRVQGGVDPYTTDTGLMYGAYPLLSDGTWESDGQITFECAYPLPVTIRALNIQLETTS